MSKSIVSEYLSQAADRPVSPIELAGLWRMSQIRLRCHGAAPVVRNFNAPAKIRGAWGRALAEGASPEALAGGPCGWDAPCAYDLFFNPQGRLTAGLELPKPFVIALEPDDDDLLVDLTLFGIATEWTGEAADGLVRALRVGLDSGARRRPLAIADRSMEIAEGVPLADLSRGAVLRFVTPVALREGERTHAEPAAMIASLANRIGGLARWHGARLDLDPAALKSEAQRLGAGAVWRAAHLPPAWQRGSRAQGRSHSMIGMLGELALPSMGAETEVLLSLGSFTHVGARTALGAGRFRIASE